MAKNPSRKWAFHSEWCYERAGYSMKALSRFLKTHRKTINAWDVGVRPVPHWAPKLLRLHRLQGAAFLRQLGRPDPRNEGPARWAGADAVNEAGDEGDDHAAR